MVTGLASEVVAQEQAADGVLDAAAHLHHVLHDLLDGGVLDGHVDGADGDHEVQARDDVAGILDKLVQVGEVVYGVVFAEVDGEVAQSVEDGHVKLVVLLGAQAGGSQLGDEGGARQGQSDSTRAGHSGRGGLPALEGIHQLAGGLEAAAHEHRLLAHDGEGILEQAGLVLYRRRRRRHCWSGSGSRSRSRSGRWEWGSRSGSGGARDGGPAALVLCMSCSLADTY